MSPHHEAATSINGKEKRPNDDTAERPAGGTVRLTSIFSSAVKNGATGTTGHPITQMVFTASVVGIVSGLFFFLQSIANISELTLLPITDGTGGLGKISF